MIVGHIQLDGAFKGKYLAVQNAFVATQFYGSPVDIYYEVQLGNMEEAELWDAKANLEGRLWARLREYFSSHTKFAEFVLYDEGVGYVGNFENLYIRSWTHKELMLRLHCRRPMSEGAVFQAVTNGMTRRSCDNYYYDDVL